MHHDFGENGEGSRDTEDWITDSTSKILLNSRFDKQKLWISLHGAIYGILNGVVTLTVDS